MYKMNVNSANKWNHQKVLTLKKSILIEMTLMVSNDGFYNVGDWNDGCDDNK